MSSNFNVNNNGSPNSLSDDPTQNQAPVSVPDAAAQGPAPLNYLMALLQAFTDLTSSELLMEQAHADMYSLDNKMVKQIQDTWSQNINDAITAAKAKNNGSISQDDQLTISGMQTKMNTEVSSGQSISSGMQSQLNLDAGNLQKAADLFPIDQIMNFSASIIAK